MTKPLEASLLWASLFFVGALTPAHVYAETSFQLIASGLNQPMVVTTAAGSSNLYVAEKDGVIRTVNQQTGASSIFLDISSNINTDGERGLLGFTFDPNYSSNGHFYVNYSDKNTGNTIIERYTASNYTVDPSSANRIMTIEQPANETSHKAGWIGFRPGEASNLYIATGDGAWHPTISDPYGNGQNLDSNLGKMLRIDVTQDAFSADSTRNYAIPTGNMTGDVNPEIWAYGLRNPFRNSFDSLTGDLWIGDVGFSDFDEVNFVANGISGGTNFGWDLREGNQGAAVPGATDPIFTSPVLADGSAIIGGLVYRGPISSLVGMYLYADFVQGKVKSFRFDPLTGEVTDERDWTNEWLLELGTMISSFGTDADGNLFITDFSNGRILGLRSSDVNAVPVPGAMVLFGSAIPLLIASRRKSGLNKLADIT